MTSRFPAAFRLPALACWAILCPLDDPPSLRSAHRITCWCPEPNGVAVFHTSETRPGWAPPISRDWRCSLAGVGSVGQRLPRSSGQSCTPLPHPICGAHDYETSTGVHSRSPVRSSPSPVAPGWNGRPWA